ncbi:MAG: NAD-dependent epimerase/dehydratase family protein [Bdellovibrionaceae bacterium]|nr:NAD-dependent epimerase/dehydratase family protein [Pseudobdellovibrionaceae bacterium]
MGFDNVLITGAGGFLGSHLTERLLKKGHRVIAVDNFCTGLKSNRPYLESLPEAQDRLFFVEADVTAPWEPWLKNLPDFVLKKVSHVLHFASPASPPLYQEMALETMWVNSIGTNRAMEFADGVGARVVFASTSEIYGDPDITPQPESYWGNVNTVGIRSCYDEAKRFGESLIFTHNLKKNTRHGFVRIFNTYGPRMNPSDGRVVINLLVQALDGKPLTIFGEGKQTRSFCYVDDLCAGIELYAQSELTEPVNIGNDREFTILELAQIVQRMFPEKKLDIRFMEMPKDDPRQRRPDLTKAKKHLQGWAPRIALEDGLVHMRRWLESQARA